MKKMRLSDYLFIHTDIHNKLSKNVLFLLIGIFLVGVNDVFFGSLYFNDSVLSRKEHVVFTLIYYVSFSIFIGIIDILAVASPLSDFSNYFRNKTEKKFTPIDKRLVMSSYIFAHYILLIPFNLLVFWLAKRPVFEGLLAGSESFGSFLVFLYLLVNILLTGIILKSLNASQKMHFSAKIITFIVIYLWLDLTSLALNILLQWVDKLYIFLYNVIG